MLAYLKRILFIYLDAVQDHKTIKLFQKAMFYCIFIMCTLTYRRSKSTNDFM